MQYWGITLIRKKVEFSKRRQELSCSVVSVVINKIMFCPAVRFISLLVAYHCIFLFLLNFEALVHVCFNMWLFFSILKSIEFSTSEESGDGEKMVRFDFCQFLICFNFRVVIS